jgi:nitrogen fixation/metabolism regulation signal transduction histidine kinase
MSPRPRRPRRYETRILTAAIVGGLPAVLLAASALLVAPVDALTRWTLGGGVVLAWLAGAMLARERALRPLQTLANMIAALREGDFSLRARGADPAGAMGLALWEVNALADALRARRLEFTEASALLRHVMDEIDVALFAFDAGGRLRLVNREGERLIDLPAERSLGRAAAEIGLAEALAGETPRLVDLRLPGRAGRWEVRHAPYRQDGRPHTLVVMSDLSRALREEERDAWQRLVRVLSHEINNSLTPIQSLAGTLRTLLERGEGARAAADLHQGLDVIEARARSLTRFMNAYARLARLPQPRRAPLEVGECVRRVAALEPRLAIAVAGGPPVTLQADGDQLDQLLINLVRNAVDAALETGGGASVGWSVADGWLELRVEDEGPGIAEATNLFVPFFTTKAGGTGIGLALSRQIAENHGGSLTLADRQGARGAVAVLRLPLGS